MPGRAPTTGRAAPPPVSSRSSSAATEAQVAALSHALAGGGRCVVSCEPTAEGVLSAVGLTYLAHADPSLVRLARDGRCQPRLGEASLEAACDVPLALRVHAGLERACARGCPRSRGGRCRGGCPGTCVRSIAYACASDEDSMPEVVHRYVRLAFAVGHEVGSMPADPAVAAMRDMATSVTNECERTRQFVRFSHMADGSYLAVFRPKADTVPLVAGYFAARMGAERFCLVDPAHRVAALHDGRLALVRLEEGACEELCSARGLAADERYVRAMWRRFYDSVALPGRDRSQRGYDLRGSWMPRRLWEGLTELDPRSLDPGGQVPARYRGGPERRNGAPLDARPRPELPYGGGA